MLLERFDYWFDKIQTLIDNYYNSFLLSEHVGEAANFCSQGESELNNIRDEAISQQSFETFELAVNIDISTNEKIAIFEFLLALPEGISLLYSDESEQFDYTLSSDLIIKDDATSFVVEERDDGSYYCLCYNMGGRTIMLGTKGEIVRFRLNVDKDLSNGIYAGSIKNALFGSLDAKVISEISNTDFELTVLDGMLSNIEVTISNRDSITELHTYTAMFTNNAGWEDVYAYAWTTESETTTTFLGAWPGTKLEVNSEGVYTVTIVAETAPEMIIFNDGNGNQTEDLVFVDGKTYTNQQSYVTAELNINVDIDTNNEITAFQFNLALPEGVSLLYDNETERIDYTLSSNITNRPTFAVNEINEGLYICLCVRSLSSHNSSILDSTKGGLVSFGLKVDNGLQNGIYEGSISNILFVGHDMYGDIYDIIGTDVDFDLTISDGVVSNIEVTISNRDSMAELAFSAVTVDTESDAVLTVVPVPANALCDASKVTLSVAAREGIPDSWRTIELQREQADGLAWTVTASCLGDYTVGILYDGEVMGTGTVSVNQRLSLSDGWQWIALQGGQVESVKTLFGDGLSEARSEKSMVINDPLTGYWGTLTAMDSGETYKVKVNADGGTQTTDVGGEGYHAMMRADGTGQSLSRTVHAGWNWVGNPYQYWQDVNDVFSAGSHFDDDDMVKQKSQFAVYAGGQWLPSISMEPGQGMMLYKQTAGQVEFRSEYGMEQHFTSTAASRHLQSSIFNFHSPSVDGSRFDDNMAMIARVEGVTDPASVTLWAFAGSECRGWSVGEGGLQFITIHGQSGETFTFKVFDHVTGELRQVADTCPFAPILGTVTAPVILNTGEVEAIESTFSDATPEAHALYDLQGRRVKTATQGYSPRKKGIYIRNRRKVIVK